jgi:hydrogenase nickel incorporation protein HypB
MCTTCGCGSDEVVVEGAAGPGGHHSHPHPAGDHHHAHAHEGERRHPHASDARIVAVEQDLLARNDAHAAANRRYFEERAIFALNLVSGPGSGKTSLLVRTALALKDECALSVIEGDQQTSHDVERIRATGVPGIQINTGKGCHLDAHMVAHALETLAPEQNGVLFIENVGNLVCPAAFDLGEAHKVVIVSTTEGEDKPLKYPDMIAASDLLLINKVDLLPHLDFDVDRCIEYARRVKPQIETMLVSATTGEGVPAWLSWIRSARAQLQERARPAVVGVGS